MSLVNIYSPTDRLGAHRIISESASAPSTSSLLGREALFIPGGGGEAEGVVKVQNGGAAVMSKDGLVGPVFCPQSGDGTCPESLREWLEERRVYLKGRKNNQKI